MTIPCKPQSRPPGIPDATHGFKVMEDSPRALPDAAPHTVSHMFGEIDLQKTAIDAMNNGNEILNGFSFKYASGASGNGAEVGFAASPDLGSSSDTTLAQLIQAMASLPSGSATLNSPESAVSNDNPAWHLATIAAAMH